MATTTPNFGWSVPTSSDLVKNGATAIETLGDSIDASLVDLKGGTTGQVLAKATDTDMDFTWTTASAGSSNVAGKNAVLNSNFSVWQRGTSVGFGSYAYTADRWQAYNNALVATASRQATNDTTNLPFIQYCARVQRNSGSALTNIIQFSQPFETINSIQFAGKTLAFSFYARKGANYSATSDALSVVVASGTGTDERVLAGYTGANNFISSTATLTSTWQRFTYSGTAPTTATEIGLYFNFTPTGTAGANDYYEITGVQLEIASSASAYSPNAATFQGELAACQRYYFRTGQGASTLYEPFATWSSAYNTTTIDPIVVPAPVTMRVNPTALEFANIAVGDGVSAFSGGTWSLSSFGSEQMLAAKYQHGSAALTAFRSYLTNANNSTSGYLAFSAEL
jgi:hypothetical protein